MNTFVEQLRIAHAILSAYNRGDRSIPQLAHRTGLSVVVCAEWVRAMHLEIEHIPAPRARFRKFQGRDTAHLKFDI